LIAGGDDPDEVCYDEHSSLALWHKFTFHPQAASPTAWEGGASALEVLTHLAEALVAVRMWFVRVLFLHQGLLSAPQQ
jgi:hypothetical protein